MAAGSGVSGRHVAAAVGGVDRRRSELRATGGALPSPEALVSRKRQRLDLAATKLYPALARNARGHEERLLKVARQLAHVSPVANVARRSEEHTSELQSRQYLVCRLLLEKKNSLLYPHVPLPSVLLHLSL